MLALIALRVVDQDIVMVIVFGKIFSAFQEVFYGSLLFIFKFDTQIKSKTR